MPIPRLAKSPIRVTALAQLLKGYPKPRTAKLLISGFSFGFDLGFRGRILSRTSPNLPSAIQHPQIVSEKIQTELAEQRIFGPFKVSPFNEYITSPIGLVPKSSGKFRMIHHLSYPRNSSIQSVNSGILPTFSKVKYLNFQQVLHKVAHFGPTSFAVKCDISNAFRLLPVRPDQVPLLGFKWQQNFFFDGCAPFGCSSSCSRFELFSSALHWIFEQIIESQGLVGAIFHYLDDYLLLGKDKETCSKMLTLFRQLCSHLGVPLNDSKTSPVPVQTILFLGLLIDILNQRCLTF